MTDFLERPELIDTLDSAALGVLLGRVKTLEGKLLARILTENNHDKTPPDGDRLLTADEAAAMLAVPRSWVYSRGKRLGLAVQLGDSTLRYSRAKIEAFMREKACNPIASRK